MMTHKGQCEGATDTQWTLHGEWTADEINTIEAFFREHMTPKSGYPWAAYKDRGFSARRLFWEGTFMLRGQTLQELTDKIHYYYATYEGI